MLSGITRVDLGESGCPEFYYYELKTLKELYADLLTMAQEKKTGWLHGDQYNERRFDAMELAHNLTEVGRLE